MEFKFKIQKYQTDAVNAVVDVFKGQGNSSDNTYNIDRGIYKEGRIDFDESVGHRNSYITLTEEELLANIQAVQARRNLARSKDLSPTLGACDLDIEMETGTGKTYVYIKTIFELNKRYGWTKFIIIVPSIAIREGVMKSFKMTQAHFKQCYDVPLNCFIYDSNNLNQIESFSSSGDINVMIINTQAFASSFEENKSNKVNRIIYSERDDFGSRRPIDVICANRPILILDEPQKLEGARTKEAMRRFKPLFSLYYSATHKTKHHTIYALDAVDAFQEKLVKKIEVKGFHVNNLTGGDKYRFVEDLIPTKSGPTARIDIEIKQKNGSIKRKPITVRVEDRLYDLSGELPQYDGITISEINLEKNSVSFSDGVVLQAGSSVGNINEEDLRRIQIRETIESHFDKEENLFDKGIKTLSLFFIDEVSKYRKYDEEGTELIGDYAQIFEEEYSSILKERMNDLFKDTPYYHYLERTCIDAHRVHNGYFSIDKSGHSINGKSNNEGISEDISAYELILKNKERLLSFDEPTRFIFSHSALREGWDNPNIFQICTLKDPKLSKNSTVTKRQEVGRGLRLCVDKDGNRMDADSCGKKFHDINSLTVIASESYQAFVTDLQNDIAESLYSRPKKADKEFFIGKSLEDADGSKMEMSKELAAMLEHYLIKHDFIDFKSELTEKCKENIKNSELPDLPDEFVPYGGSIIKLLNSVYDERIFNEMIKNGNRAKVKIKNLNANFQKEEFVALWKEINHKYAYTVHFDTTKLVEEAISKLNDKLLVSEMTYTLTKGSLSDSLSEEAIKHGTGFSEGETTHIKRLRNSKPNSVSRDLIGDIVKETNLTRKTIANILKGLDDYHFGMYAKNPEEFISKAIELINEVKATMVIDNIEYTEIEGKYGFDIFENQPVTEYSRTLDLSSGSKAIQDFVPVDSNGEREFATALNNDNEIAVFAKIPDGPNGFQIPTPLGGYSPDWAIAFKKNKEIKHIYFVTETKGSDSYLDLKPTEKTKIDCATKLYEKLSKNIKYHMVKDFKGFYDCFIEDNR